MTEQDHRPQPGQSYWNDEGEDTEIAEVVSENEDGTFTVTDEDGEQAVISWNIAAERWEVDA
jgi:hypothetical protein